MCVCVCVCVGGGGLGGVRMGETVLSHHPAEIGVLFLSSACLLTTSLGSILDLFFLRNLCPFMERPLLNLCSYCCLFC